MEEDRDLVLARFQDFTKLENTAECVAILDQFNWNSEAALNYYLNFNHSTEGDASPIDIEAFPIPMNVQNLSDSVSFDGGFAPSYGAIYSPGGSPPIASHNNISSSLNFPIFSQHVQEAQARTLLIIVTFEGRNIPMNVYDTESVDTVRRILRDNTGIALDEQELTGWPVSRSVTDDECLRDLDLPSDVRLQLTRRTHLQPQQSQGESSRSCTQFTFAVKNEDKSLLIILAGDKSVRDLKVEVASKVGVPLQQVQLGGWPDAAYSTNDRMRLGDIGIAPTVVCNLTVTMLPATDKPVDQPAAPPVHQVSVDDDIDDDDDDIQDYNDYVEDIEEEEQPIYKRPQTLIPDGLSDEKAAEHFRAEFIRRYGPKHPNFYIGSLDRAIQDHVNCPASRRKMLALLVHSDLSVLVHIFCENQLCSDMIVDILDSNFVTWAWDITSEVNKKRFSGMCSTTDLGRKVLPVVNSSDSSDFPLVFIVSRVRGSAQIMGVIKANIQVDEFINQLILYTEEFRKQKEVDMQEEWTREEKEREKREQDAAYHESLAADRAKEEQRKRQEEEEKKLEEERRRMEQEQEEERRRKEKEKEELREQHSKVVPDEPPADSTEQVSTIRIRCPDGATVTRRFLASTALNVLLSFLTSRGYHMTDYRLLRSFPKIDVTTLDASQSLLDLKMFPNETLTLTEK